MTTEAGVADAPAAPDAGAATSVAVRRGLPRVPGGEPWPPATATAASAPAAAAAASVESSQSADVSAPDRADVTTEAREPGALSVESSQTAGVEAADRADATTQGRAATTVAASDTPLRRGLPRVPGGEPWPAAGFAPALVAAGAAGGGPSTGSGSEGAAPRSGSEGAAPLDRLGERSDGERATAVETAAPATAQAVATTARDTTVPLAGPDTVVLTPNAARWNAERVARQGKGPIAEPEPQRYGPFTKVQWIGAVVVTGFGLLVAAALAVVFVRWFLSLDFMQDFLTRFPGEYHLPEGAPVGFPAWLGWQHFFNFFLMVLIIRSGLRIRTEKRPTAFWTPRRDPKGKVSLTIWFHQSLDILWLVNGLIFVVLLFVTGQWMRVIPTSWEVFPNALSAILQYISLDWPTENGWVNYNSIQQLAYFTTIFIAAPLAAITGYRMSGMWPKNAKGLNKAYPIEWARAVHFPVMLYFVAFIAVHVFLVLATGALRNLNHMYAAQGSTDPAAYADNWTGFWFFVASLVVIAAAWIAARPLTLAPIARLFGTVSSR